MESALGVVGLILFCAAVIALAAGVTFLVIRWGPGSRAEREAAHIHHT